MSDKLTVKQERYVQGLFTGMTQREAYKRSYDCSRTKDKNVDVKACELAKNGKVARRLRELTERVAKRNTVTVEKLMAEYSKIGFADIKDFIQFKTVKTVIGHDDDGTPIIDYMQIVEMKSSDEVDGTLISEVSIGKDGTLKFKLHDKKGSLDSMAKHLGMFVDRVETNINLTAKLEDFIK